LYDHIRAGYLQATKFIRLPFYQYNLQIKYKVINLVLIIGADMQYSGKAIQLNLHEMNEIRIDRGTVFIYKCYEQILKVRVCP